MTGPGEPASVLTMADPIHVAPGVTVPASAIEVSAVRSSGPGGQNVNKVASKIDLRVEIAGIVGLDDAARARLRADAARRLDSRGFLIVTSQRTRDQSRNLEDAREKVRALIARSLIVPKRRRPTRATAGARERRLQTKKRDAAVKSRRGRVRGED
ncbi:MAG: alternative ribosome rescue aminoacyl-tRNA hydrolase ArfB [Solirubrobacterales bacterium]